MFDELAFNVPTDAGGGYPQNTYDLVGRVDWNISDKTTFYGRYALYSELDLPGTVTSSPYAGYNTGDTTFDNNYFALRDAHFLTLVRQPVEVSLHAVEFGTALGYESARPDDLHQSHYGRPTARP